jgi:hypothetical protein
LGLASSSTETERDGSCSLLDDVSTTGISSLYQETEGFHKDRIRSFAPHNKLDYIEAIMLPAVLCACETWPLYLREQHRLRERSMVLISGTMKRGRIVW